MTSPLRHPLPVYRTDDIRRLEAAAFALPEAPALMERAGRAAAELGRALMPDAGGRVLVVAGPGNNGGDAFVIARLLKAWWYDVTLVFAGDAQRLSADAHAAHDAWLAAGGTCAADIPRDQRWGLIVDGLFGIGLTRDVAGRGAELIARINDSGARVLAVDVPSGLDSDTGRVHGCAVRATHTLTFIALKPGLLTLDGPDHCGELQLSTLGLDVAALRAPRGTTLGEEDLRALPPSRAANTHKGTYGSVGIVGGATGMVGAALLAGRAALKLGSGRVYLGLLGEDAPAVDGVQPELMLRMAGDLKSLEHLTAYAIGPGLSRSTAAREALAALLPIDRPLVLDADALNLLGEDAQLAAGVTTRRAPTVLTPHPAEAARLLGCTTAEVQADRVAAACELAARYRAEVVVKGAGSVCASPDGTWSINTSGNPGMASAGMGDVLTGFIAALLAQGVAPQRALRGGVYLHGAAADAAVRAGAGPIGLTASETIDAARARVNRR